MNTVHRVSEFANQQINKSTNQQINKSTKPVDQEVIENSAAASLIVTPV
tara:strand:- start:281 stop:427 length:147 start_codon:yes stop_codon:yes gene_type:complete